MGTKFTVYNRGFSPLKAQDLVEKAHTRQELAAICYVSIAPSFFVALLLRKEGLQNHAARQPLPLNFWNQVTNFNQLQQRAEASNRSSYKLGGDWTTTHQKSVPGGGERPKLTPWWSSYLAYRSAYGQPAYPLRGASHSMNCLLPSWYLVDTKEELGVPCEAEGFFAELKAFWWIGRSWYYFSSSLLLVGMWFQGKPWFASSIVKTFSSSGLVDHLGLGFRVRRHCGHSRIMEGSHLTLFHIPALKFE